MIGDDIRTKREELGLSQEYLARAVGTTQQTIQRIESNQTQRSSFIPKIIEQLKLPYDVSPPLHDLIDPRIRAGTKRGERQYLYPMNWGNLEPIIRYKRRAAENSSSKAEARTGQVPVLELGGMLHEQSFLNKSPIDYIERGDPLMYATNAYSVKISLDDMYPAMKAGEIVLVNPSLSPLADEPHLFLGEETGELIVNVAIGYLITSDVDNWRVQKFNPKLEIDLDRVEYPLCHRIVGKFTRR